MTSASSASRRRLRTALAGTALATTTILGTTVLAAPTPAAAAPVAIANCGTFEMEPSIYWVYGASGGPTGQLRCPTSNTGYTPDGIGRYTHFQSGSIYWKAGVSGAVPHIVLDPVRSKWQSMGWERSLLGYPTNDTYPVYNAAGQLGVFNEFDGGTVTYSQSTGAHEVHGAIRDRWKALGVAAIGLPTSDEMDFAESGKVSYFERGAIYWWSDTGPIAVIGQISVSYTGIQAYEEMDWDQSSNSDEPYAVLGAITPTSNYTTRSSVYDDVDSGEGRNQKILLYRGAPNGINLTTLMMENDSGNPDEYKNVVKGAVAAAAAGVTAGVAAIPVAGPYLALAAGPALAAAVPKVTNAVNNLLDTGDDKIGQATINLSPKQMVVMTTWTPGSSLGVPYKVQTPNLTGGGSRYRASFTVEVS